MTGHLSNHVNPTGKEISLNKKITHESFGLTMHWYIDKMYQICYQVIIAIHKWRCNTTKRLFLLKVPCR